MQSESDVLTNYTTGPPEGGIEPVERRQTRHFINLLQHAPRFDICSGRDARVTPMSRDKVTSSFKRVLGYDIELNLFQGSLFTSQSHRRVSRRPGEEVHRRYLDVLAGAAGRPNNWTACCSAK